MLKFANLERLVIAMTLPWEEYDGNSTIVQNNEQNTLGNYRHNVVNVTEIIAVAKVAEVVSMMDSCSCPKCVDDVLAIALNTLPTRYVTTDMGKQFIQLNSYRKQFETDVVAALIKACQIVNESPRHDL